jgi:hypothetical protein
MNTVAVYWQGKFVGWLDSTNPEPTSPPKWVTTADELREWGLAAGMRQTTGENEPQPKPGINRKYRVRP